MIACVICKERLDGDAGAGPEASISGAILGDEYTESWYRCRRCDAYTIEVYRDRFLDEGTSSLRGPIAREAGDAQLRLIRQCPEPWDKQCRCAAHRAYFEGALD